MVVWLESQLQYNDPTALLIDQLCADLKKGKSISTKSSRSRHRRLLEYGKCKKESGVGKVKDGFEEEEEGEGKFVDETICDECGMQIESQSLRLHLLNDCLQRIVKCRHPGCEMELPISDMKWHLKEECVYENRRSQLLERTERRKVNGLVTCSKCNEPIKTTTAQHLLTCSQRLVECPNYGCGLKIALSNLQHHISEDCAVTKRRKRLAERNEIAKTKEFECDDCKTMVTKRTLAKHQAEECPYRKVSCPLNCGLNDIVNANMKEHLENDCTVMKKRNELVEKGNRHKQNVKCSFGCGEDFPEILLLDHCKKNCIMRYIHCECGACIRWKDRELHKKKDLYYTIHSVPRCIFAVKRDGLAKIAYARDRRPETEKCVCGETIVTTRMKEHKETFCKHRYVTCKYYPTYCNLPYGKCRLIDMENHHEDECPGAERHRKQVESGLSNRGDSSCPNGCGKTLERKLLKSHVEMLCEFRRVPCRLGCGELIPFEGMDKHTLGGECRFGSARNKMANRARIRKKWMSPLQRAKQNNFIGYLKSLKSSEVQSVETEEEEEEDGEEEEEEEEEEINADVKEDIKEDVKEDIKENIKEDIKEDTKEDKTTIS